MARHTGTANNSIGFDIAQNEGHAVWVNKQHKLQQRNKKRDVEKERHQQIAKSKITLPKLKFMEGDDG